MRPRPLNLENLDQRGFLSIVVQGGLLPGNLVETARNCQHWRAIFPQAEIILSISVADVLAETEPGVLEAPQLAPLLRFDGLANAAFTTLRKSCDRLVLSTGDLPLPPFKDDSGLNNYNLQLAAAKAGLAEASGEYVLRTRSDLIFADRRFVEQHLNEYDLPRGSTAVFEERVAISWLFTLNPFTIERMPFHFSDWFNFGRLTDVTRLWGGSPMTLADAVFYKGKPHPLGSNRRERQFMSRLGIEQHLHFGFFSKFFPDLHLSSHNDSRSAAASLAILADNFTLCDVAAAGMLFEKYGQDVESPEKQFHCLTEEDWRRLVDARSTPPEEVLGNKIDVALAAGFL